MSQTLHNKLRNITILHTEENQGTNPNSNLFCFILLYSVLFNSNLTSDHVRTCDLITCSLNRCAINKLPLLLLFQGIFTPLLTLTLQFKFL